MASLVHTWDCLALVALAIWALQLADDDLQRFCEYGAGPSAAG